MGRPFLLAYHCHGFVLLARTPGQEEEYGHDSRPPRLVAGTDARAVVSVEVLVEQQQVVPVGVCLELFYASEYGPAPGVVLGEGGRQAVGDFDRDLPQVQ